MREILFKAKRTDNGEWVEGCVVTQPSGKTEIFKRCTDPPDILMICEVDPATLCQYTGVTDEKDKKIYENDIIAFEDTYSTENGYAECNCEGQVVWDDEELCFAVTERLSAESYEVLADCVVIGNIFDNPELLEG